MNYTANYTAKVLDFSYQSQGITFADWISLFTLCLAPLIAHIVSGAPRPIYLSQNRPRWHDRICIHNPTTILWRYFAIADRRIRAKAWGPADMAASNAYFWTARGWDGSEEMVDRSRAHCVKLPGHARTELVSENSAKSVVVAFQGVQALYTMTSGVASKSFAGTIAIDTIFFPLAVFGLLRLWATFWLTEDYSYVAENDGLALMMTGSSKVDLSASGSTSRLEAQPMASIGLLGMGMSTSAPERRFHSINSWRGWAFRILCHANVRSLGPLRHILAPLLEQRQLHNYDPPTRCILYLLSLGLPYHLHCLLYAWALSEHHHPLHDRPLV